MHLPSSDLAESGCGSPGLATLVLPPNFCLQRVGSADTRIPSRNPRRMFLNLLLLAAEATEDGFARVSPLEAPVLVRDLLNQRLRYHVMMADRCTSLCWSVSAAMRQCPRVAQMITVGSQKHSKQ